MSAVVAFMQFVTMMMWGVSLAIVVLAIVDNYALKQERARRRKW